MTAGTTCYERDEALCDDQMCLRTGCRLRNERLGISRAAPVAQCDALTEQGPNVDVLSDGSCIPAIPDDALWALASTLHSNVSEDIRPMSWSDYSPEQVERLRNAAKAFIEKYPASLTHPTQTVGREALAETVHKARWPADRQLAVTPFADEDRNGREYCFRIADAILSTTVQGRDALWVCTGCGSQKTLEQIKGENPTAFSCCPERKMAPYCSTGTNAPLRWRHKKRGTTYTEVGRGNLQIATDPVEEDDRVVIYRSENDGRLWVRGEAEFQDGRFEAIASSTVSSEGSRLIFEGSRLTFCETCNASTMHRRASVVDGVQTFECQRCAPSGSAPACCQVCGAATPLRCGPSRFGEQTWACEDCWNPEGSAETSTHQAGTPK